jgi:HEAT repeat protein
LIPTPDQIAARLLDPSPEVRRRALRKLVQLKPADAIRLGLLALGDGDWRVRKETVLVLGELGNGADLVAALLGAIEQEDNVGLRNAAAEALSRVRGPAFDIVVARLGELAGTSRKIALEVIGRSADTRAARILVEHLAHADVNLSTTAAELLGEHGGAEVVDALTGCLQSADSMLVLAALQSLNRLGAHLSFDRLEPLAANPLYGMELMNALGRSGDPAAVHVILRRVADDPAAVKALTLLHESSKPAAAAVEAALGVASADLLEALAELAARGGALERRAAVLCLLWSRRAEHIALLVTLAQEESLHPIVIEGLAAWSPAVIAELDTLLPKARGRLLASVIGVLSRLLDDDGGRQRATLFSAHLNSADLVVATAASGALARFGDETVVPRLFELAGAQQERVRRAAGHALAQIGLRHPEAVRAALHGLDIESERGVELMRVYQVVGRPEDVPSLAAALSSPLPALRRAVLGAIAAISGPGAVQTISLAMTDENTEVRMAAVGALSRIGPAASETIVSALRTAEGSFRAALVRALGRVGHPEAPAILRGLARESAEMAMASLEAFQSLGLDPGELKGELLNHKETEVVKKALVFLDASVTDAELVALLGAEAWDVRLAAVERLSRRTGDGGAVADALREAQASEEDDLVHASIERALAPRSGKR